MTRRKCNIIPRTYGSLVTLNFVQIIYQFLGSKVLDLASLVAIMGFFFSVKQIPYFRRKVKR